MREPVSEELLKLVGTWDGFDVLLIPHTGHAMMDNMYFRRRRWHYFVQHLLGLTPPSGYQ